MAWFIELQPWEQRPLFNVTLCTTLYRMTCQCAFVLTRTDICTQWHCFWFCQSDVDFSLMTCKLFMFCWTGESWRCLLWLLLQFFRSLHHIRVGCSFWLLLWPHIFNSIELLQSYCVLWLLVAYSVPIPTRKVNVNQVWYWLFHLNILIMEDLTKYVYAPYRQYMHVQGPNMTCVSE